jgi:hypothetical protein
MVSAEIHQCRTGTSKYSRLIKGFLKRPGNGSSVPSNSRLRRLDLNCQRFDDGYDMDLSTVLLALEVDPEELKHRIALGTHGRNVR